MILVRRRSLSEIMPFRGEAKVDAPDAPALPPNRQ
jgi:hypothetical protein